MSLSASPPPQTSRSPPLGSLVTLGLERLPPPPSPPPPLLLHLQLVGQRAGLFEEPRQLPQRLLLDDRVVHLQDEQKEERRQGGKGSQSLRWGLSW